MTTMGLQRQTVFQTLVPDLIHGNGILVSHPGAAQAESLDTYEQACGVLSRAGLGVPLGKSFGEHSPDDTQNVYIENQLGRSEELWVTVNHTRRAVNCGFGVFLPSADPQVTGRSRDVEYSVSTNPELWRQLLQQVELDFPGEVMARPHRNLLVSVYLAFVYTEALRDVGAVSGSLEFAVGPYLTDDFYHSLYHRHGEDYLRHGPRVTSKLLVDPVACEVYLEGAIGGTAYSFEAGIQRLLADPNSLQPIRGTLETIGIGVLEASLADHAVKVVSGDRITARSIQRDHMKLGLTMRLAGAAYHMDSEGFDPPQSA